MTLYTHTESENAMAQELLKAITWADGERIRALCAEGVELQVPGARVVDLTARRKGADALAAWAEEINGACGRTSFAMHRYFENGCELMASGTIHIQRHPRTFSSPCSIFVRFEAGKIVLFQLLLDTSALERFRGLMD